MATSGNLLLLTALLGTCFAATSNLSGSHNTTPLRWGFAGCGRITNDWAATIASLSPDHQAVAFASRNAGAAQEYATRFGAPKSYGSYEELAQDPDVDVVYIGTINPTHYEISKLLLANNKHILCEKPLTLNTDQAREIFQIVEQKKLFFQEAVLSRFFPVYGRMREILKSGRLGEVKMVTAYMGQNSINSQRHIRKELGGGSLKDVGGYTLQFALQVLGNDMPDKIHAVSQLNNETVDTTTAVILQWKDGRIASLGCSTLSNNIPTDAYIYGFNATFKIPKSFNRPEEFEIIEKGKGTENHTREKHPLPKSINFRQLLDNGAGMIYQAREVRRCIQHGLLESPYMTHKDSLTIMAIEDEILRQVGVNYNDLYQNGQFVGSKLHPEHDMTTISM